jgi:hypothetical protein
MNDTGALEAIVDEVLAANAKSVEEFRAGKDKAFNALVGQVMKASKGKANPAQAGELLKKKLAAEGAQAPRRISSSVLRACCRRRQRSPSEPGVAPAHSCAGAPVRRRRAG